MAIDKKISELPVTTGINANDISVLVNNGVDYQFSISLLLQFLTSSLSTGAAISFGVIIPQNITGKNGDLFIKTDTDQFIQKIAGSWIVVYTLPVAKGANGTVLYGSSNPSVSTGKNLDTYINTTTGIFYFKSAGVWNQVFSMQTGPQGPQGNSGTAGLAGIDGKTILNGITTPSNLTGSDGDFYINTSLWRFYGPKTVGVWGNGVSMFFTPPPSYIYQFISGESNPIVISNWQSVFFDNYGNAEFLVQLIDEGGNLQDRPDLAIKRIIDRTGAEPVQTSISLDYPEYPSGQIIIKYSNLTLI